MSDFPSDFSSWESSLQQSFFVLRKAEADARKAEAEADARKTEAAVRMAEIRATERSVGFEILPIKVTHWTSLDSHYIQVPKNSPSFLEFQKMVRLVFNDDITTDDFRLYLLPVDGEIDERILVDEARFGEFLGRILEFSKSRLPSMFVWNYESSSPTKLPGPLEAEETGSLTSRSTGQSTACRDAYESKCLCCGDSEAAKHAAHVFDIGVYNKLGKDRVRFLRGLDLVSINELANLICLCTNCHTKFDNFRLGIDPTERMWTVSAVEREDRPEFYRLVHGKRITFYANGTPTDKALKWKWLRFVDKNEAWYCCLCDGVFKKSSATEMDFDAHKLACKLKASSIAGGES